MGEGALNCMIMAESAIPQNCRYWNTMGGMGSSSATRWMRTLVLTGVAGNRYGAWWT